MSLHYLSNSVPKSGRTKWHSATWWTSVSAICGILALLIGFGAWWFPQFGFQNDNATRDALSTLAPSTPPTGTPSAAAPAVTSSPSADPTAPGSPSAVAGGPLNLVISFDTADGGKVGTDTYRSPRRFGWTSHVYDDNGELTSGCYINWTLYDQAGAVRYTYRDVCSGGAIVNGFRLGPGRYEFVGKITTESGRTGSGSKTLTVVENG